MQNVPFRVLATDALLLVQGEDGVHASPSARHENRPATRYRGDESSSTLPPFVPGHSEPATWTSRQFVHALSFICWLAARVLNSRGLLALRSFPPSASSSSSFQELGLHILSASTFTIKVLRLEVARGHVPSKLEVFSSDERPDCVSTSACTAGTIKRPRSDLALSPYHLDPVSQYFSAHFTPCWY